jgi:hypothetical protein
MKQFIYLLLISTVVITSSCELINLITEEEEEEPEEEVIDFVNHVAMLYENDLYYFADFSETPVKIETPASSEKTLVKIHPTETKFAYLDENRSPIIIGLDGTVEAALTQYTDVKMMDWTADGQTLYILVGNEMFYYGTALSLPDFTFEEEGAPILFPQVTSASVSPNNDLAYTVRYFDNTLTDSRYREKLIFKLNDGSKIVRPNYDLVSKRLTFTNFSTSGDLAVGFSAENNKPMKLARMQLFKDLTKEPQKFGDLNAHGMYVTPTYRSDVSYFLVGYQPSSSGTTHYPYARFSENSGITSISREEYTTIDYDLYLDWR